MADAIVQPGPILSLAQEFDPEAFRAMIYSHPNGERIRWWKAYLDPAGFTPRAGMTQSGQLAGHEKWLYEEQVNTLNYRALIQGSQTARKFLEVGSVQAGDLVVTTMPDELPIEENDWITPWGRTDSLDAPDTRTIPMREIIVRGATEQKQTGTVSSSAAVVTGVGTSFLTTFRVGDVFGSGGQELRVSGVTDNTHLTLESSPSPAFNANAYSKFVDLLVYNPVAAIDNIRDAGATYRLGTHFVLSGDKQTIQWLSASVAPAPKTNYSVSYRYYPKYVVMGDAGLKRHVVDGVALPQRVIARLAPPDTYKS